MIQTPLDHLRNTSVGLHLCVCMCVCGVCGGGGGGGGNMSAYCNHTPLLTSNLSGSLVMIVLLTS